ncbi:MAG: membrane protein [Vulcanimicrobiaceae bacterium]
MGTSNRMTLATPVRALIIGAAAGLRSMTPVAAVLGTRGHVMAGPAAVAAAGELLVDKLPIAPARTSPPALVVRIVSGALCARALARRTTEATETTAIAMTMGALGSLAASYGGLAARRYLTQPRRLPGTLVALVEDAVAIGLARAAAVVREERTHQPEL